VVQPALMTPGLSPVRLSRQDFRGESYLPEFFESSTVRTADPDEADIFIIPNNFLCRLINYGNSAAEIYLIPLFECVPPPKTCTLVHRIGRNVCRSVGSSAWGVPLSFSAGSRAPTPPLATFLADIVQPAVHHRYLNATLPFFREGRLHAMPYVGALTPQYPEAESTSETMALLMAAK
jgi:hypothetical protein